MTEWPVRGQQAPDFWDEGLRGYIDAADAATEAVAQTAREEAEAARGVAEDSVAGIVAASESADAAAEAAGVAQAQAAAVAAKVDPIASLNGRLAASRRGPVRIVVLGSSTTEGVGATRPEDRWVSRFANAVQQAYPSGVALWEPPVVTLPTAAGSVPTLPGVHVINGGISGATASTYCQTTQRTQIETVVPRAIIHMIGSNDQATNIAPGTYKANVEAVLTALDALVPGVIHILCDTFSRPDLSAPAHAWSAYVSAMQEIASARANVSFIGQNPEWVASQASGYDPVDPYRLTEWRLGSGGGIHPSDAGHSLLAANIARELRIPPARPTRMPDVMDRFSRTALGSAETSQAWEQQSGVHVPADGALTVATGGNAVLAAGFSDCEVSALVTHNAAVVPGIICKSDGSTTRLGMFLNGPSNRVEVYENMTLLGFTGAMGLVSGREYFLRFTVRGNSAIAELDGVVVLNLTLSGTIVTNYAGRNKHGVRCSVANAGVKWRNFAVRRLT